MSSLAGSQSQVASALDPYEQVGRLGTGLFSKVWLIRARKEGGKQVALKVIDKAGIAAAKLDVKEYIDREIEALRLLGGGGGGSGSCGFVCSLEPSPPVVEDGCQTYLPLVAHLGGELLHHVSDQRKLEEPAARFHISVVALALGALHKLRVLHRDLKLENIVLDRRGYPVLIDLGSAAICKGREMRALTLCGTPEYAAPEMVKGLGYDTGADFWALGVLLYRLLVGVLPFLAPSVQEVYNRVLYSPTPVIEAASLDAKEIFAKLLTRHPERRLKSLEELKTRYWFEGTDWEALEAGRVPSPTVPAKVRLPALKENDVKWTTA